MTYSFAYASSAGASPMRTRAQSAPISSAAIIASAVCAPCPISQCGIRIVTSESGATVIQVLSSPSLFASSRFGASASTATPSTKPPPATVPAPMKARRVHTRTGAVLLMTDGMDRSSHARERAAAADVGDAGVDVLVRGSGMLVEQRGHRHDHPALAVAA